MLQITQDPLEILCQSIRSADSRAIKDHCVVYLVDPSISSIGFRPRIKINIDGIDTNEAPFVPVEVRSATSDLSKISSGDFCKACHKAALVVQRSIELGHTFNLGDRYSKSTVLDASVATRNPAKREALRMGCHGVGLSRIITALADSLRHSRGLRWPRHIAPFEVLIIPAVAGSRSAAEEVYDMLQRGPVPIDCIIDDRDYGLGSKTKDAQLIGYPIVVIVGRKWERSPKMCEVEYPIVDGNRDRLVIS